MKIFLSDVNAIFVINICLRLFKKYLLVKVPGEEAYWKISFDIIKSVGRN